MSGLGLAVVAGLLAGFGAFLVVLGLSPRTVRLADALAVLDGRAPTPLVPERGPDLEGLEALGAALQRRLRLPVTQRQQQLLLLQDRSVGDFFAEKLVLCLAGLLLPTLWVGVQFLLGGRASPLPLAFGLVGAVAGYFLADWSLARGAKQVRRSTTESIHTFFDLVALERLANASAAQAVSSAAEVSEAPLFRRISSGLERARLEQATPWQELARVSRQWDVPELVDFADVMRLEEQGAALADVLQARVKELREAHVARQRSEAQEATESLTVWMTIPALLLGLAFVIPPLLTITGM